MTADDPAERPGPRPSPVVRWLAAGIWLFYLEGAAAEVVRAGPGWRQALGIAALVVFVATYLIALNRAGAFRHDPQDRRDLAIRWSLLVVLVLCVLALVPAAGDEALTGVVFISAAGMGSLRAKQGWILMLTLFAATEAAARLVPGWSGTNYGFAVILAGLAVWGLRTAFNRQRQLVAAERELRELAIEEERSRIARDLHDILGHSLTVISVKTELAERMIDIDLDRTRTELRDLSGLARDALADVRSTALGVRGVSLPGEIAAAREALASAGIDAELPTAADEVPSHRRELFAWAVREGVTNVVRHSGATTCRVSMTPTSLSVVDDGAGPDAASPAGQGLEGLRQRCRLAGATLAVGPGPGGVGFSIRVEVRQ